MKNYWGDQAGGRRKGFGYVPELYGFIFYKAQGKHPVHIEGKSIAELGAPKYLGYELDESKQPVFSFSVGMHTLTFTPRSGPGKQTLELTVSTGGKEKITFKSPKTQVKEMSSEPGKLVVVVRPNAGDRYSSDKKVVALKKANKLEDVKVVGFDGQRIGKEAILRGEIYADPIQFPQEIGRLTVQQMLAYKNGDEVKSEILIPTKLYFQEDAQKDPSLKAGK